MIKSIDRIVSAKDYGGSMRGYLREMQRQQKRRGVTVVIRDFDKAPTGKAVPARIWQSQWVGDCPDCNTTMFVDPDEPVFFCFGCGNRMEGGRLRPVEFPAEREEIERLLLERPVTDAAGLTDLERVGMQRAVLVVDTENGPQPLTRSWRPGETVADLERQQRDALEAWRKELRHGVR